MQKTYVLFTQAIPQSRLPYWVGEFTFELDPKTMRTKMTTRLVGEAMATQQEALREIARLEIEAEKAPKE